MIKYNECKIIYIISTFQKFPANYLNTDMFNKQKNFLLGHAINTQTCIKVLTSSLPLQAFATAA